METMTTSQLFWAICIPLVFLVMLIMGAINIEVYSKGDRIAKRVFAILSPIGIIAYICWLAYLFR